MQELCRRSENGEPQRLCAIQLSASQEAALLGDYSPLLLRKKASPLLKRETYHLEGGRTFLLSNAGNLIFGPARALWRRRDLFANACICAGAAGLARGSGAAGGRPARVGVRAIERSGMPRESRVRGATVSQRPPPADSLCLTSSAQAIAAINATRARPVSARVPSECIEKVHNVLLLLDTQCSEGLR